MSIPSNPTEIDNIVVTNDYNKIASFVTERLNIYDVPYFLQKLKLYYNYENKYKFSDLYTIYENINKKFVLDNENIISNNVHIFENFLENVIKINKGQYILYSINDYKFQYLKQSTLDSIFIKSLKYSSLPIVKFMYSKINKTSFDNYCKYPIFKNIFFNSDDRVYKYILSLYDVNDSINNYFLKGVDSILGANHIPDKYKLRRIKYISKFFNINDNLEYYIYYIKNFNMLYNILKYNYTNINKISWSVFNNISELCYDDKYLVCKENITNIYNLLKTTREKNSFYICFTIKFNETFNFNFIKDENNYGHILNCLIGNEYNFQNNLHIGKIINEIDINSFTSFFKYCNKSMFKKFYSLSYYKPIDVTLVEKKFINQVLQLNKCHYYLKRYINRKIKYYNLRNKLYKVQKEDWYNKKNINVKEKFNYIPPYHLLPGQLDTIGSVLIKEKADGELCFELPSNVEPYVNFTQKIKAEYIEDLDLYLVFDIELNDSIMNRYKYLRNIHPFIKSKYIEKIYDWDDFIQCINIERAQFKKFLDKPYTSYRWYPKAAWEIVHMDHEIILELQKFINNKSKVFVNWICNEGPFENDGFILTPLNGKREIKVKPKQLLTIDLLYKDGKWIDRDNYDYSYIIKEGEFKNGHIYRCYPVGDKYEAKDIRFDKNKPNPRNVVNNLISLYKCDFTRTFEKIYYTKKTFNHSEEWKHIITINDSTIKRFVCSMKNNDILDLGCGNGKLLKFVNKYNKYYGMDFDMNNIITANTRYNSNKNVFNYINLSETWDNTDNKLYTVDSNKYDTVYAINSLMHFCTDEFWRQLNLLVMPNTEFVFNIVNDKLSSYHFGFESYIKRENDTVKYYFEFVHDGPITEPFIDSNKIDMYLSRNNWSIIEKYTPNNELNSFYTWYKVIKN